MESETAGALLKEVTEGAVATIPVEPEDVYRLGEKHDYKVELFWQPGKPAHFDALFISNQAKVRHPECSVFLRVTSGSNACRFCTPKE